MPRIISETRTSFISSITYVISTFLERSLMTVRVILQAIGQRANGGGKQYPRRISITAPLLVETRVTWNREAG